VTWLPYALLSAVFAGATAILGKLGVAGIPSNLATAVRTVVILVFAWAIAVARGEHQLRTSTLATTSPAAPATKQTTKVSPTFRAARA
jgi:uncharacterized membrane protein